MIGARGADRAGVMSVSPARLASTSFVVVAFALIALHLLFR